MIRMAYIYTTLRDVTGPERQPARAQPVRLPVLTSPKLALGCLVSRGGQDGVLTSRSDFLSRS